MSDCNKEEENWSILYYAYEDFNRGNPIVEHFPTKEAAEERNKEIYERWHKLDGAAHRRHRFADISDRQLLELIAEKLDVVYFKR